MDKKKPVPILDFIFLSFLMAYDGHVMLNNSKKKVHIGPLYISVIFLCSEH